MKTRKLYEHEILTTISLSDDSAKYNKKCLRVVVSSHFNLKILESIYNNYNDLYICS